MSMPERVTNLPSHLSAVPTPAPTLPTAPGVLQELDFDSHDLQACVAMMQGGSKTFFAASRLLPPRVRTPPPVNSPA